MTTIDMTNQYQSQYTRCAVLKGSIKMLKVGMKHSRMTNKAQMEMARDLTGGSFRIRDYDAAIHALEQRMKALLVYIANE